MINAIEARKAFEEARQKALDEEQKAKEEASDAVQKMFPEILSFVEENIKQASQREHTCFRLYVKDFGDKDTFLCGYLETWLPLPSLTWFSREVIKQVREALETLGYTIGDNTNICRPEEELVIYW